VIINIVNLKLKLSFLSSQKKIKFFKRHMLSNAFCQFRYVRKRTNVFLRRGNYRTTKWKNTKINCKSTGGAPSQI